MNPKNTPIPEPIAQFTTPATQWSSKPSGREEQPSQLSSSSYGAEVGDLFMTLIHSCQLCGANSFDYLTELQRHAQELAAHPAAWMPWNYHRALEPPGV